MYVPIFSILFSTSDIVTLKILLGDAIVCWRATILWLGNRVIKGTFASLVLVTFGALRTTQ